MNQEQPSRVPMNPATQKGCCCGPADNNPKVTNDATPAGVSGQTHDPVCGMVVQPASAKNRTEHGGQIYYFCCGGCNAKFIANPGLYLKPAAGAVPSGPN